MNHAKHSRYQLIIGNSNKRFSGVTSTMLQTLPYLNKETDLCVLGSHHLPKNIETVSFREAAQLLKKPLSNGRPRIFHARRNDEMIQALLLKKICKAHMKIVFTSTAQRYHSRFTRLLLSKMDAVISTCSAAASYLEHEPAKIIPHGVNTTMYRPAENREAEWKALGLPGKYGIGIFGRVRTQKGIELFIDACIKQLPLNPDFTAVIIGNITSENKPFVRRLEQKIQFEGLSKRIIFLGEQPFDHIPILFRAMSLICALSYNEGFGLTVLEALSSGVAVLATEAGAWPDILKNHTHVGRLAPVGSEKDISRLLGEMITDRENLLAQGKAGRKLIEEQYKIEDEAKMLTNFFEELSTKSPL